MTPPLAGVVIADFSRMLAGPYASMVLADLGATVIKLERAGRGDDTRAWGPPWTATSSAYYEALNRSKLSCAVDLHDPDDLALARRVASGADVIIENFRTGTMAGYGLDYPTVASGNPRVVYASITGFGSGAGAELPGYDFVAQAVGGLMSITGDEHGDPMKVGVALVDVLTGKDAALGILAGLRSREIDGHGQLIEVNLLSSLLGALVNQASGMLTTGASPHRLGNRHPSIAPYETLRCGTGTLAVACASDAQFIRLAGVLGRPELAREARFATNAARVAHREELVVVLEAELARDSAHSWEARLRAVDLACGRVGDIAAALALAGDLGLDPTYPAGEGHPDQVRNPITFSHHHPRRDFPPPGLGEHDELIRRWYPPRIEDHPNG